MMKHVLLSLLLSSGFAALSASTAFAQSTPNTTQTDQSEEDWRKSKKKSSTDDPLDGFINTNGWGQGTQRSLSPVDMLPEESRRFLMKKRAQKLAEAGIGEPVDTSFEPSDAAKTDAKLESDEKAAWSEMMKDVGAGDPNGDPNATPGGTGGAPQLPPQIPTQVGEIGGDGSSSAPSVMRGGSSASVSDILAQIKGGGAAPTGQISQGSAGQAQAPQDQAQQGNAPTAAEIQAKGQAQAQADAATNAQNAAQSPSDGQANADAQAQADTQASAAAQAAVSDAAAQAAVDAAKTRTPEAISPLDRLKQSRDERAASGKRSSASDYLKRGN